MIPGRHRCSQSTHAAVNRTLAAYASGAIDVMPDAMCCCMQACSLMLSSSMQMHAPCKARGGYTHLALHLQLQLMDLLHSESMPSMISAQIEPGLYQHRRCDAFL